MRASWPSENLLLGLLAERPMHGYELARLVCDDEALRAIWHLKRSEVYFLLGKLQAQGHIAEAAPAAGDRSQRQAGGPPRQVYEVTPGGRALLEAWLGEPVASPRELRAAFLAKLYLAERRGPAQMIELLERQRQVLRRRQERLSAAASADSFLALANRLRLAQVEAGLRALDDIQTTLSATS
jgi:DNA-binding PadR family transcriptional regulator